MTDKSLGLGKLLAKSKSTIRRARRGSVDDGNNSIDSDDASTPALSFSPGLSSVSHMSQSQSVLDAHHEPGVGNDNASIVIRVPTSVGDGKGVESTTSLVSSGYDSEDPDLL